MGTGSSVRAPGGAITGINVTPLVDVTLVLLVVFLVTAKVIVRRQELPVDLPRAASGQAVQEVFAVVVSADGRITVDGERLERDDDLLPLARAALAHHSELRAAIQADGVVPHRRVMHVLDLLKQAGVARIGFGVVPPDPPGPAAPAREP
jgi:biopolymer transport protein ExbD